MNNAVLNYLNIIIEIVKGVALYVMPIAAFIVSLIALKRSKGTMNVQVKLSEVEEKLKECELELKKRELEKIKDKESEKKIAKIEARIYKISNGKYRLKVWNSGNTTAYNVNVHIPNKYNIAIISQKMPYEYLEVGKSFEEGVVIHMGSFAKFEVISTWYSENGERFENKQLESY